MKVHTTVAATRRQYQELVELLVGIGAGLAADLRSNEGEELICSPGQIVLKMGRHEPPNVWRLVLHTLLEGPGQEGLVSVTVEFDGRRHALNFHGTLSESFRALFREAEQRGLLMVESSKDWRWDTTADDHMSEFPVEEGFVELSGAYDD
ncbi:MAG: hypothetical protein B7X04_02210 [Parcubacteria group bacterium 21-54-25]|nr:MAG: hypothetical protein B7X04_02210 [Parcubacteria group bacterium 21-54-25]HQU07861.1 hypothetical protein [Candidatus Paceibacterota bacterium]